MASNYSVRCTVLGTLALLTVACGTAEDETTVAPAGNVVENESAGNDEASEIRLTNLRQLTNGGENAEAYFSSDGSELIFQTTREGFPVTKFFVWDSTGRTLN